MNPSPNLPQGLPERIALLAGVFILMFWSTLFLFESLWMQAGGALRLFLGIPAACAAAGLTFLIATPQTDRKIYAISGGIICVIAVLALLMSRAFFDVSWDGQTYHQEIVIQLVRGWNPLHHAEPIDHFDNRYALFWARVLHFPKALETGQAWLYQLTGRIESGKAVGLTLGPAVFGILFSALTQLAIRRKPAALFAALLTLNPVTLVQSLSFYIDGWLAAGLLGLAAFLIFFWRQPNWKWSVILAVWGSFVVNLKFTGVVFTGFLLIGFAGLLVLSARRIGRPFCGLVLMLLLLGMLAGAHPYLQNARLHHNIFHPLAGPHKIRKDLMRIERPAGFETLDPATRLWRSVLSASSIDREPRLKVPGTFTRHELLQFAYPDPRLGGFGPLFSAISLVALFLVTVSLTQARTHRHLLFMWAGIVGSSLLMPESWWARYAPQLWWAGIVPLLFWGWLQPKPFLKTAAQFGTILALANVLLVALPFFYKQASATRSVSQQLQELSRRSEPVQIRFSVFRAARVRLEEHGIAYREDPDLSAEGTVSLNATQARMRL